MRKNFIVLFILFLSGFQFACTKKETVVEIVSSNNNQSGHGLLFATFSVSQNQNIAFYNQKAVLALYDLNNVLIGSSIVLPGKQASFNVVNYGKYTLKAGITCTFQGPDKDDKTDSSISGITTFQMDSTLQLGSVILHR